MMIFEWYHLASALFVGFCSGLVAGIWLTWSDAQEAYKFAHAVATNALDVLQERERDDV